MTLFSQGVAEIASLLSNPLPHRISSDTAHIDAPGIEFDKEEHVETAKQHRVDVEEITCQHRRRLGT